MKTCKVATLNKELAAFSPDELISRGYNKFEGWTCAAGVDYLFIDWDGNMFPATCQAHVTAPMGNVFSPVPVKKPGWMACNRTECICQGELEISKFKDSPTRQAFSVMRKKYSPLSEDLIKFDDVIGVYPVDTILDYKNVLWAIGRRCNYSCYYCDDVANSKTESLKSGPDYDEALNRVLSFFPPKSVISFTLMGGEPTLYPGYLDLCKKLADLGHYSNTITNGSRTWQYLSELMQYSALGISVHFDSIDDKEFYQKIENIARHAGKYKILRNLDLKLMSTPQMVDRAFFLGSKLNRLKDLLPTLTVRLVNIRIKNSSELMEYPVEQMEKIIFFNRYA